jgi:hypothetical protein
MIGEVLPNAVGGLPAEAPSTPATPTAYPAVHNMPPARGDTPLSADQQKQLEDDLVAARNRYGGNPDAPSDTGKPDTGKPDTGKSDTGKTATGKTATGKTATGKTATGKTATGKTATGKTADAKAGGDQNP